MVTKAESPAPEPTTSEKAESFTRNLIAGHPQGAIRRIVLYAIAAGAIMALSVGINAWWALIPGLAGSTALGLLMGTDGLL